MGLITNYTSLQANIADMMNRGDATSSIPYFIQNAETEMGRRLRVRQMVQRATATVGTSDPSDPAEFERVPSDFAGNISLDLEATPTIHLTYADPDKLRFEKSQRTQLTGDPEMYAIIGNDIQFFPAMAGQFTASMVYWKKIPPLGQNTTNWLLADYPDAYLYGSLVHSGQWLRGDPRKDDWEEIFLAILNDIQEANKVEGDAPRLEVPSRLVV